MAKIRLILQVFDRGGDIVYSSGVDTGTNDRPNQIAKAHLKEAFAGIEQKADEFRQGDRTIQSCENKTELFTIKEDLLVKIAKALVQELRPDLKGRKASHYLTVKDTQTKVISKTALDIVFKKEE